ncbi:MAG: DUF4054 domain-containing protein [Waterburya sp.]
MALNPDRFLDLFPEFSQTDFGSIEATLISTAIESSEYAGLPEDLQEMALALHVAHYLELAKGVSDAQNKGQRVKRYKSKHDEIEYQQANSSTPYSLDSTSYGVRLQKLLASVYVSFCY